MERLSFRNRLRLAWRVLCGKLLPAHNVVVSFPWTGFSRVHLHSSCWASAGKKSFAEGMIRRELFDLVSPHILFTDDPSDDNSGSTITGDLYIYVPEQEANP